MYGGDGGREGWIISQFLFGLWVIKRDLMIYTHVVCTCSLSNIFFFFYRLALWVAQELANLP